MNNKNWTLILAIALILNVVMAIVEAYVGSWEFATFNVFVAMILASVILDNHYNGW